MAQVKFDTHQTEITEVQKSHIGTLFSGLSQYETGTRIVNAKGTNYTFRLGGALGVFLNSAFEDAGDARPTNNTFLKIGEKEYIVGKVLGTLNKEGIINYASENGITYAQYDPSIKELKVLFDVMANEKWKELLKVIAELVNQIHLEDKHRDSYKYGNGLALIKQLTGTEIQEAKRTIERAKRDIRDYRNGIDGLRSDILKYYRKIDASMREVKAAEELDETKALAKLEKEFNNILEMDKVLDIRIDENKKIILETDDIYCYHDVNEDERYYIGKFLIKIDIERGTIYFNNTNNRRKSYWGEECSHPHVDEHTWGTACFGNVDSTIAELSHQREFYALATIAIDFLENVNTSDSAGEYIRSWDIVNENGVVLQEGSSFDDPTMCECCEETVECEDTREVITGVHGDGSPSSTEYWCEECRDQTTWDNNTEEFYSDEAYDELQEIRREEERFDIVTDVDDDGEIADTERFTEDEAENAGMTYLYDGELDEYIAYEAYEKLERIRKEKEEEEQNSESEVF